MPGEIAIDLNIDQVGPRDQRETVARLVLVRARGFTRDGSTPTMTEDCPDYRALEVEGERLKGEIDDALARARAHFTGAPAPGPPAAPTTAPAAKPGIATGLTVRDVMTREVRTVHRNDRLSLADELMQRGRFRHVVVLDDAGAVAGVLSRRDIFHGALAWSLGQGSAAHEKSLASYPVKQVMSADPTTVAPDTPLRTAAGLMAAKKIGCLPVVEGGTLVGILTEGDFLALLTGPAGT